MCIELLLRRSGSVTNGPMRQGQKRMSLGRPGGGGTFRFEPLAVGRPEYGAHDRRAVAAAHPAQR